MKTDAILLGAGESQRFGSNKLFTNVFGESVIRHSLRVFEANEDIENIILVVSAEYIDLVSELVKDAKKPLKLVAGGVTRSQSALIGLQSSTCERVVIHDVARCNLSQSLLKRVLNALEVAEGVAPVISVTDSVISENEYLDRNKLQAVQTPQGFVRSKIIKAIEGSSTSFTDEGSAWISAGNELMLVEGEPSNKKLTYKQDLFGIMGEAKIGNGYDLHELVEGRKLVLAGVRIEHSKGLLGHSDADVILHAVMDALLSSLSLGDIGVLFPDSDPRYKDANSVLLLLKVLKLLREDLAYPESVAVTVLCEKPRLSPYRGAMINNLSTLLNIPKTNVGLTFTTTEGIGDIGEERAIACYATCLVRRLSYE